METLSPEQSYAFELFKQGKNIFLSGPGGTGKTLLIKHMVKYCMNQKIKFQVCALTGCAALLLNCNARTLHSWGGIKLARGDPTKVIDSVIKSKRAAKLWRSIKVLIIDEVSMMSKKILEIINEIACRARGNRAPFGGIQVVFSGDFFQLPPIETFGEPDTAAFCFEAPVWNEIFPPNQHILLKTIFRQTDPIYREILNEIRVGELSEDKIKILRECVGRKVDQEKHAGCIPPKLFAIRAKVDLVNTTMFSKIKEEEHIYEYKKRTDCLTYLESETAIPSELLKKCNELTEQETEFETQQLISGTQCNPILRLKKGASVMCTVNLDLENGICNGSQGIVENMVESGGMMIPVVRFSNGIKRQILMHWKQSEDFPRIAIGFIPLCLSWAMTIHKIQGATLKMAEMDIGSSIFEYGQTYVALSRVESLDGLYLSSFDPIKIRSHPKVVAFYRSIPEITYEIPTPIKPVLELEQYRYVEEPVNQIKVVKLS
jgi:ATP-dependent DNA helicase PIF1